MPSRFSIKSRINSFKYAFSGLFYFFKTQINAQIHLLAFIIVIVFGFLLKLNNIEWVSVLLASAMVISAEIFNTAIETIVDFISPEYHHKAGLIKDIAAAGVLITAIFAIIIGVIVFLPKII
jgi:diacylglycerol kinase